MAQLAYALIIEHRPELAEKGDSAIWWYLKAAQAGIPAAQRIVGSSLIGGEGARPRASSGSTRLPPPAIRKRSSTWLTTMFESFPIRQRLPRRANYLGKPSQVAVATRGSISPRCWRRLPILRFAIRARALVLIEQVGYDFGMNPIWSEITAAAHAHAGRFREGAEGPGNAVRLAKKFEWNSTPQESRLADYAASRPGPAICSRSTEVRPHFQEIGTLPISRK